MRQRQVTMADMARWPLYASLRDWSVILRCSRETLRNEMRLGRLKGDIVGNNRWYFTRTQIARWYAPALLREEDLVGRLIEPGKDMV
jgi:hypothetical protein